jgi:hypothetical protein
MYSSYYIKTRKIRCVELEVCMEETKNMYKILVIKPQGKRSLEKSKPRWEDNSEIDLK